MHYKLKVNKKIESEKSRVESYDEICITLIVGKLTVNVTNTPFNSKTSQDT